MKTLIFTISICSIITGCMMLPSVQSVHPLGYGKLIEITPACNNVKGGNSDYAACLHAAELLETSSPQQATTKFIASWEETSFGMAERNERAGETAFPLSPSGGAMNELVWGVVKNDDIRAHERIVLPVLKKIYSENSDDYSAKMFKQTNLIIINSRSSLDSFRAIHTKLLIEEK